MLLCSLSRLRYFVEDHEAAYSYGQQSLRIAQETGDPTWQAEALYSLGQALTGLGQLAEAFNAYQRRLELHRETFPPEILISTQAALANILRIQGDLGRAMSYVEDVLVFLEDHPFDGSHLPFWRHLLCYRVLKAVKDPRGPAVLNTAHTLLQNLAARIGDDDLRRSYLENMVINREIVEEWTKLGL